MLCAGDQSSTGSVITEKKKKPPLRARQTAKPITRTIIGCLAQKKPSLFRSKKIRILTYLYNIVNVPNVGQKKNFK